mgnify:CR=1 FL=1
MKIRNGFVSNSSSSSFLVIDKKDALMDSEFILELCYPELEIRDNTLYISSIIDRHIHFGWDVAEINSVVAKIVFSLLQSNYLSSDYFDMLYKTLCEYFKVDNVIFDIPEDAYIDHQSAASEGRNLQMFSDVETLKKFLFSKNSIIVTGNDND